MELENFTSGCIAVEKTVASIYSTFMELFPGEKDFWADLFYDEMEHSYWLSDINNAEVIDLLPSEDISPSIELITNTLSFVEGKMDHVKVNPLTLEDALKIALKIEESMVETFTNELTANLFSPDYDSLSNRLIAAEKKHIGKIEAMMIARGFMKLS